MQTFIPTKLHPFFRNWRLNQHTKFLQLEKWRVTSAHHWCSLGVWHWHSVKTQQRAIAYAKMSIFGKRTWQFGTSKLCWNISKSAEQSEGLFQTKVYEENEISKWWCLLIGWSIGQLRSCQVREEIFLLPAKLHEQQRGRVRASSRGFPTPILDCLS